MNHPIFLVSTGRTGTKYFSKFFAAYGQGVVSIHTSKYTRLLNILGNMYFYRLIPKPILKWAWVRLKYAHINSQQKRYIECNPYYGHMVDILGEIFPEAKFVFVVRHPKSFTMSFMKWEKQRWMSRVANRLIPYWQSVPLVDLIRGLKYDPYQRVEFYTKAWNNKNCAILEKVSGDIRFKIVRFEDVFDPRMGVRVMRELLRWLGLKERKPITDEVITRKENKTRSDTLLWWDDRCSKILGQNCGPLMARFRYHP